MSAEELLSDFYKIVLNAANCVLSDTDPFGRYENWLNVVGFDNAEEAFNEAIEHFSSMPSIDFSYIFINKDLRAVQNVDTNGLL